MSSSGVRAGYEGVAYCVCEQASDASVALLGCNGARVTNKLELCVAPIELWQGLNGRPISGRRSLPKAPCVRVRVRVCVCVT